MAAQMTFGQRFALTIAIVFAILFALALFGYLTGGWDDANAEPLQPPTLSKYEKQLIALDREAINGAYREQVQHLFLNWAKDGQDQPRRAVTGAKQARRMFDLTMAAIDERERRYQQEGSK